MGLNVFQPVKSSHILINWISLVLILAIYSFDETVYKLKVPTQQDGVLKRSLELLRDWAADLTFVRN